MYHQTKPFFPYWLETALGVEGDQDSTDTYFETIDSNGDGNLQVWEFLSLQNVQLPNDNLDRGFWGNVKTAFGIGQQAGGWLRDNVYNFQTGQWGRKWWIL